MDEAELCQGPGQGAWLVGGGGPPAQIRFVPRPCLAAEVRTGDTEANPPPQP